MASHPMMNRDESVTIVTWLIIHDLVVGSPARLLLTACRPLSRWQTADALLAAAGGAASAAAWNVVLGAVVGIWDSCCMLRSNCC